VTNSTRHAGIQRPTALSAAVRVAGCDVVAHDWPLPQFRLDFEEHHKRVLGDYLFPDAKRSRVDYERLLEAVCMRDLRRCEALRAESLKV
jgi:hypothetical protein